MQGPTDSTARGRIEPFFGVYDAVHQPHVLDMPLDQLTFNYVKWRPKLVQQLYHIHQIDHHKQLHTGQQSRAQRLHTLAKQFEALKWSWTPPALHNPYTSKCTEPHDVPVEWQMVYQLEALQARVSALENTIQTLTTNMQSDL